ncbi:MAG: hypothetical protein E7485_08730 [Ruminococcaceae bacterium]|nr:hypothetical protein [Oscillospiraceae bacterium]
MSKKNKWLDDPANRAKYNAYQRQYKARRKAEDPDYKERKNKQQRDYTARKAAKQAAELQALQERIATLEQEVQKNEIQ